MVFRREIKKRIKAIAPFLQLIGDPYLISVPAVQHQDYNMQQSQYWIVEGYTTSLTYPYATRLSDDNPIRYIRNSVKAVVDAYNGSIGPG